MQKNTKPLPPTSKAKVQYCALAPEHFDRLLILANHVHGENYLDREGIEKLYKNSFSNGINASVVSLIGDDLVGFRLTIAADKWLPDEWCSPEKWPVSSEQVCYFKCNTVDSAYRQLGIGSTLLKMSIDKAQQQGAKAGLAHIWLASPGNSAFRYFSKCGGKLVKEHPGKWRNMSINEGYDCPVCPQICECIAAEMLLTF
ncbi:GNAT family N-acetyltransferase [Aliiglaciecola litoralis]|uniref:N-acetyltransferase domain-containing protein n=1 Tax=Aliiglaciecola litoralis TaxID=582857 RepID=A0ABP3X6M8_9ALTE